VLFFAFNKQAFANYYFFVIGAIACAIAELAPDTSPASNSTAPPASTIRWSGRWARFWGSRG
jgi:hypothetical protein